MRAILDLAAVVGQVRRGMVPAHVYGDPEIFALERDRLFARCWVFLVHESEIPDRGDYVARRVLADSFIVVRDESGVVRVLFNMCLHRGMQVCRAELGNASHFRCPYHTWTYRNDGRLAGLPFHGEAYAGEDGFALLGQSLLPAPSMDMHNGLIFISMDPQAPPLRDYLGDFAFYLDFYTRQSRRASSCAVRSGGGSSRTGRSARTTAEREQDMRCRTPLQVAALTGDDHASSYVFLASDRARGITGAVVHSDGGIGIR